MIGASLYIIVCSFRNRMRVRLQRLRQPRYLFGAIAGAAYLYFSVFARFRSSRARGAARIGPSQMPPPLAGLLASAPAFGGLALMAVATGAWLFPVDSGLLEFSDAELQFLFPAPVSRRQLLVYRVLRSQLGMLFGALMIGVFMPAAAFGFSRLRISIASWILMVTGKIYFTGVTLARSRLGARAGRARRVAWLPLGGMLLALAVVIRAIAREYLQAPPRGVLEALDLVARVAQAGAAHVVLWPFVALARPLFAEWPGPYLLALPGALLVLFAIGIWVLLSDEAFQEAAGDVAERRSQEPAKKGAPVYKVRSTGWTLAPTGRPEAAFAWKAAMQTLRMVDRRSLARMIAILFSLTIIAASMGRANGLASMLGAFSFAGTVFAILLAPQVVRMDMRQDLAHLELLKTWPVKASAVVRGELLWPGAIITAGAWTMLVVATYLSGTILGQVSFGMRMGGGAALAIVAPALVFSQLTIHNAVALIFPAWVPLGNQRPRGLDAMGQRLIMLGGTWLLLILSALPGALAGAIVWFALQRFVGPAALVLAAMVCTGIVGVEVLLATEAIGPAYERIDLLSVERAE
jgi:hypothetical protein